MEKFVKMKSFSLTPRDIVRRSSYLRTEASVLHISPE